MKTPSKIQLKGRMAIRTEADGTEAFYYMTGGIWRKLQSSSQTRDHRFREATKAEIESWKKKTFGRPPKPAPEPVVFEDEVQGEDVPEDSPVELEPGKENEEDIVEDPEDKFNEELDKIESYNGMEEFLILELDYDEDMDRTVPIDELKGMARELKAMKDAGME